MPEILLIDDSPTPLSVREAVLKSVGFSVLTASSAEQALTLLGDRAATSDLKVIVTTYCRVPVETALYVSCLV